VVCTCDLPILRQPRPSIPGVRRTQDRVGGLLAGVPRRVGGRRRGLVGARLLGARLVGAWLALSPRIIRGLIPWVLRPAVAGARRLLLPRVFRHPLLQSLRGRKLT